MPWHSHPPCLGWRLALQGSLAARAPGAEDKTGVQPCWYWCWYSKKVNRAFWYCRFREEETEYVVEEREVTETLDVKEEPAKL